MRNRKTDIDTVLLDFDGTVMNTNKVIIESWQHTFRMLEGKERPEKEIIRTFGEPLRTTMKRCFPDMPVDDAIEIYRNWQEQNFGKKITVFPGMTELLASLKAEGYKIGLITSRMSHTTHEGLRHYNLDQYFDAVVAFEDAAKPKPDPDPVLIGLEKLDSVPEKSIMLGDSMFDILCAKNAGTVSVLVGWAEAVTEEEKNGPDAADFMIEKAEDLFDIL